MEEKKGKYWKRRRKNRTIKSCCNKGSRNRELRAEPATARYSKFIDERRRAVAFTIIRQDITRMDVHAIVNAANTELKMGGGVCGAIFKAAGARDLERACKALGPIKTGEAVLTPAFALPSKYVIHAAGPIYDKKHPEQSENELRSTYRNSLKVALENGCESLAFPLISSGIYGYPKEEAFQIASSEIKSFLDEEDMDIYLVLFDKAAYSLSRELIGRVEAFIDEHYVETHTLPRSELGEVGEAKFYKVSVKPPFREKKAGLPRGEALSVSDFDAEAAAPSALEDLIAGLDKPFSELLFDLIDLKGLSDVEVYKRANMDRKHFSKIRNKAYSPGKKTVMALAVALSLNLDESIELLKRAGYAFSHASKFDVIMEYFISNQIYDVYQINEVLFEYDQPLLGA